MRRGLMAWSRDEVPAEMLQQRVTRVFAGARARSLDCVLAYTDLTRPAAVSALTHFVPYWSNGVLVLAAGTGANFVATLSRRVNDWIASTGRFDALANTLDLGAGVAQALPKQPASGRRIGVIDLGSFPQTVIAAIRQADPAALLEEAGELLEEALAGEDDERLARRAHAIAEAALQAGHAAAAGGDANEVLAAAERAGRLAGAEEIQLAIGPDERAQLRRLEGPAVLGKWFALQVTVAYKGCWIRLGRMLAGAGGNAAPDADAWFAQVLARLAAGEAPSAVLQALAPPAGTHLVDWRVEAPAAGLPLAVVDGAGPWAATRASRRGPRSLTARLRLTHGCWFRAAPVFAPH